jgi:sulfate adenylyltransferase
VAVCSPIAPYASSRREARTLVEAHGRFVLTWIDTPLEVCEARDPKGLYARARAGQIPHFTGISDPYEPPEDAEIAIQTAGIAPDDAVDRIVEYLRSERLLP